MIRAFYNSQVNSSDVVINNQKKSSGRDGVVTNHIASVRNESAISIDPYAKLKQGIVFDKGCYSHLRSASFSMMEILPSSLSGNCDSKSCTVSSLKENLLYEKSIIEKLLSEYYTGKSDVMQSIKNASVSKQSGSDIINISTRYRFVESEVQSTLSGNILSDCRDEIIKSSYERVVPKVELISFTLKDDTGRCYQMSLDIDNTEINKFALNSIFKSFDKVFNENKTTNRFLVATIAVRLRDYLNSHLPTNIRSKEISSYADQYPNLLLTGDIIINLLKKDDVKIKADKKLSFMHRFDGVF